MNGVNAPSTAYIGDTVTFSADISNDPGYLMFSYAWSWEGQWGDNWSSTKLETGGMTTDTSSAFDPTKEGTYYLWIDVEDEYGNSVTSDQVAVTVSQKTPDWSIAGVSFSPADVSAIARGTNVTFYADINGNSDGLDYNYAWSWEGQWGDNWSSTVKETGAMTSSILGHLECRKSGTYYVSVDVADKYGNRATSDTYPVTVLSDGPWELVGVNAPSSAPVDDPLTFSAQITGDTTNLEYNYAWSYEGGWDDWSSTKLETGANTTADSWTFTPTKQGTYHLWIDVTDGDRSVTSEVFYVSVGAPIEEISELSATITAPAVGATPSTSPVSAEPDKYSVEVVTRWDGSTNVPRWSMDGTIGAPGYSYGSTWTVFEANHPYFVEIAFTPQAGYRFADDLTAYLNGSEGISSGYNTSTGAYSFRFGFPPLSDGPADFTLTLDYNNGGVTPALVLDKDDFTSNGQYTLPTHDELVSAGIAPAGMKLTGWKQGSSIYAPGSVYTVNANATLVAQWEKDLAKISVSTDHVDLGTVDANINHQTITVTNTGNVPVELSVTDPTGVDGLMGHDAIDPGRVLTAGESINIGLINTRTSSLSDVNRHWTGE
ncbi:MAG: hypothetical protein IJH04_07810, partial [Eggerthellaceae bacterium]|nr:hypothetical protein [Eggerthellaceae bacterium]